MTSADRALLTELLRLAEKATQGDTAISQSRRWDGYFVVSEMDAPKEIALFKEVEDARFLFAARNAMPALSRLLAQEGVYGTVLYRIESPENAQEPRAEQPVENLSHILDAEHSERVLGFPIKPCWCCGKPAEVFMTNTCARCTDDLCWAHSTWIPVFAWNKRHPAPTSAPEGLHKLVEKWRAEGAYYDQKQHHEIGQPFGLAHKMCASELEAALSAAEKDNDK